MVLSTEPQKFKSLISTKNKISSIKTNKGYGQEKKINRFM